MAVMRTFESVSDTFNVVGPCAIEYYVPIRILIYHCVFLASPTIEFETLMQSNGRKFF
jgi:hypothetical protein